MATLIKWRNMIMGPIFYLGNTFCRSPMSLQLLRSVRCKSTSSITVSLDVDKLFIHKDQHDKQLNSTYINDVVLDRLKEIISETSLSKQTPVQASTPHRTSTTQNVSPTREEIEKIKTDLKNDRFLTDVMIIHMFLNTFNSPYQPPVVVDHYDYHSHRVEYVPIIHSTPSSSLSSHSTPSHSSPSSSWSSSSSFDFDNVDSD